VVSIIGALINSGIVFAISTFVDPMFGLSQAVWVNAAKVVATGISLIWNFLGYKFIVFKR
jgi:putative flippase GtrA